MTTTHVNIMILCAFMLMLGSEIARGVYASRGARAELWPNLSSAFTYFALRSAYFAAALALFAAIIPAAKDSLSALPLIPIAIAATLIDDYLNYWAHRLAHTWSWLWRLHKPHHALEHLNTTATISGNMVYTFILPSTTIVPLLFFLGAPGAALFLQALKTVGGLNQHSNLRWDLWLRRWAPTRVAISGVERIFVMQDFHHAHHGLGPLGRSAGNFGNIFTLFDWLHGTGHLPHAKQDRFGLPAGVSVEPWYVRVWWPILRTRERADLRVPTAETVRYSSIEIAAARAVIFTADDKAIPVQIGY